MTDTALQSSMRRVHIVIAILTAAGVVFYASRGGWRPALAFFLGAVGSFGNLLLFQWLSGSIAPRAQDAEPKKNPWSAGLFIGRYLGLWLVGYATVKALDVSPLPVLFGFLVSTAAVLASSITDLIRNFSGKTTAP